MTEEKLAHLQGMRSAIRCLKRDEALIPNIHNRESLMQALMDGLEVPKPILDRFVAEMLARVHVDRIRLEDEWERA